MTILEILLALKAAGFDPGPTDDAIDGPTLTKAIEDFQRSRGLDVDGYFGPLSKAALTKPGAPAIAPAGSAAAAAGAVPAAWMPPAQMKGIVVHWTGGAHKASNFDRAHYHLLIEDDGDLVRGIPTIDANDQRGLKPSYAAHTRAYNGGMIGVSLCCMGDDRSPSRVRENPFVPGPYPLTRAQWDKLPYVLADLCRRYAIPVTPRTVLSHAEVQPTLGIAQAGKWDITRLAFDLSIFGARACGDIFRARTAALLA